MMQLIPLLLLLLNGSAALQGVKPSRSVPNKSSQRSATAIQPQPFAERDLLSLSDDFNFEFPAIGALSPPPADSTSTPSSLSTELLGEAFGTFWIVGVGSMASMAATFANPFSTSLSLPEIALVWSFAVTSAIALCTSQKWGEAHFNPAMTLVSALFRGFSWNKVIPYSLAQVAGSTVGSATAYSVYHSAIQNYEEQSDMVRSTCTETARVFGEYFDSAALTTAQAFGVEALGTAVLAATAFAVTHPSANKQLPVPAIMGGTVFGLINWLAPFTQCGMNPARDFGPRLVAYAAGWTDVAFQDCGVYILAPLVGATMGAALVDKVFLADNEQQP